MASRLPMKPCNVTTSLVPLLVADASEGDALPNTSNSGRFGQSTSSVGPLYKYTNPLMEAFR